MEYEAGDSAIVAKPRVDQPSMLACEKNCEGVPIMSASVSSFLHGNANQSQQAGNIGQHGKESKKRHQTGLYLEFGRNTASCTAPEGTGMPTNQNTSVRSSSKTCAFDNFSACNCTESQALIWSLHNGLSWALWNGACMTSVSHSSSGYNTTLIRRLRGTDHMAGQHMCDFMAQHCGNLIVCLHGI